MHGVVVALPVYGAPSRVTIQSIRSLGAVRTFELHGCSDIAMARNRLLTSVLEETKGTDADVVLCVDADMVFTRETVEDLVGRARSTGRAWSAIYASASGHLCAALREDLEEWVDPVTQVTYHAYLAGMGLMAIPLELLRALAQKRKPIRGPKGMIYPLCTTGPRYTDAHGQPMVPYWESEDYSLSRRLGGVLLAPVSAGHEKPIPLWPDDATVETLARGGRLVQEPEWYQLEGAVSPWSNDHERDSDSTSRA